MLPQWGRHTKNSRLNTEDRAVKPGGWTTRKRPDGRTEWIPPPHLDSGQSRVNDYHHPENLLLPDDDEDDEDD
jgi:hypothetical protein